MKCSTCGAEIQPGQKYCPSCGAAQNSDQAWGGPYAPSVSVENRQVSKSEFCRSYADGRIRKNIITSAILCYFSAVVTAVFAVLLNPFMFADAVIVLVLGLVIHLKQSRVCAIILLVYGLFSCVVMFLETGRLGSWLIILAGAFAVVYTFRLEKAYRAYQGN